MASTPGVGLVGTLYLLSGALGLIYEVTFSKYLGFSFGATATASSAVLVAFMAGIALGAHVSGRLERRIARPLLAYGVVELAIGAFCMLAPELFAHLAPVYVALAARSDSIGSLNAMRGALAMLIVALPAAGMGSTLPLLARFVHGLYPAAGGPRARRTLAALYGVNTLGGALGSLGSAYLLLPALGLSLTLRSCALLSLGIGGLGVWLGARSGVAASTEADAAPGDPALEAGSQPGAETRPPLLSSPATLSPLAASAFAALSGLLVFACEVIAVHLLALVIGTSAYAFGLMLCIFLSCLALGTPLGHALMRRWPRSAPSISLSLSGLALLATLPLWDQLPQLFVALGPSVQGWWERELVRGLAALLALAVPVTLMGTTFPLLLRVARGSHAMRDVARITSCNTLGSIVGSLLAGFLLLPRLGSQRSLMLLAIVYLAAAMLAEQRLATRGRPAAVLALVGGLACWLLPSWNLERLASGSNVYFDRGVVEAGVLESLQEDVHGGFTSIVRDPATGERTLLTNGKFQGNDRREVAQNEGLGYLPSLFAARTERALLIGMGTAVTATALAELPYRQIDIAETAPAIVQAARTTFAGVNAHVLDDPRVHVFAEDGRNLLLVRGARYDVITVEVSSIWFAGAANLYNRELYELAKQRLAPGGVLQQWIAFHHTQRPIVATILATVRASFPHVALFADGHQGHILASQEPLRARLGRIEDFAEARGFDAERLLGYVRGAVLDGAAIDAFIADTRQMYESSSDYISTDDNLALEYMTPRGNVPGADHIPETLGYLYEYRPVGIVQAHLLP